MRFLPAVLLVACSSTALPSPSVLRVNDGQGSAVALTSTWALTAKHVAPIYSIDGWPALEVIEHPDLDLALVRVEPQPWATARLADEPSAMGERLQARGYAVGQLWLTITDGRQSDEPDAMSAGVAWGMSGGAVLNEAGELVGIVHGVVGRHGIPIMPLAKYVPVVGLRSWIFANILP